MQNPLSYYRQLLERYLDGTVSVAEANELFDFIRQHPAESRELLEACRETAGSARFQYLENLDAATSQRMFKRLLQDISLTGKETVTTHVHRVHFLRTSWFRYAVAIVLVAATGLSFLLLNNEKPETGVASVNKTFQTEIGPGSDKAVLTLADGSTIVLDEAKNGALAQQGNAKIVKVDSGHLSYEAKAGSQAAITFNTLSVPRGGQYALTLSDGSKVWLNAASSIKYPSFFAGPNRTVEINGEAYLEIAPHNRKPFIVKAAGTEILVLGTSFNINAYADETAVRTTLITGSAKVMQASTAEASLLVPGQQAEVNASGVKVAPVDTEQVLAWKNGLFSFTNADIKTVMRQLSRWYDINIVYENGVPAQRFFGDMNRNLTLSQVLKGLEVTKVNFRLEGRNLIVMP
jgi:transmembrane sensor